MRRIALLALLAACSDSTVVPLDSDPPQLLGVWTAVSVGGSPLPVALDVQESCDREPAWSELRNLQLTFRADSLVEMTTSTTRHCSPVTTHGSATVLLAPFSLRFDGTILIPSPLVPPPAYDGRVQNAYVRSEDFLEVWLGFPGLPATEERPWTQVMFARDSS